MATPNLAHLLSNVFDALATLQRAIAQLVRGAVGLPTGPFLEGGRIMIIVKDTQPDVNYSISFIARDAEGFPVSDAALTVEVVSDNPGAVAVTPDPADQRRGSATFGGPNPDGSPAIANITVSVKTVDGMLLGSFGEQFTVTAGDPAAIAGGTIIFEGLTPSP